MKLLITQRVKVDRHGQSADVLESAYTVFFNSLGADLVPISNFNARIEEYLEIADFRGVILSGGGDMRPGPWWTNRPGEMEYSEERDRTCGSVMEWAIGKGVPVLGICYGMQFMNSFFAGSLEAGMHCSEPDKRRPGKDHEIELSREMFGLVGRKMINHYHNNGLRAKHLSREFEAFAHDSEYDIVEGILHKSLPLMGIQWHPERTSPDREFNETLIRGFLGL